MFGLFLGFLFGCTDITFEPHWRVDSGHWWEGHILADCFLYYTLVMSVETVIHGLNIRNEHSPYIKIKDIKVNIKNAFKTLTSTLRFCKGVVLKKSSWSSFGNCSRKSLICRFLLRVPTLAVILIVCFWLASSLLP